MEQIGIRVCGAFPPMRRSGVFFAMAHRSKLVRASLPPLRTAAVFRPVSGHRRRYF
jgi:hypothetical protein